MGSCAPTCHLARANSGLGARQLTSWRAPNQDATACQLCAICVRTCNNVPLHDPTRLPRPHVPQVFVCAPCSGPLSSWRPQTTATGTRGWHAFAKSWGRFWGHIGKYTSNPAAAASTSFAGRANPPPPIWSCWPRPFCGRAAKMATASANCSTAGHTANGNAHGEP